MTAFPSLSVVIPHYNQPEQLARALRSLLGQICLIAEVLVVDDASPTGCAAVVERFQTEGLPVRLLRQPTRQFTLAARLRGMREAQGDYLAFIDADDAVYSSEAYGKIVEKAAREQADITHFYTVTRDKSGVENWYEDVPIAACLHGESIFQHWLDVHCVAHTVWCKLYSKRLYKRVCALPHRLRIFRIEDLYLTAWFMLFAEKYVRCDVPGYEYTRPGLTHVTKLAGRTADAYTMYRFFARELEENGLEPNLAQRFQEYLRKRININGKKMFGLLAPQIDDISLRLQDTIVQELLAYQHQRDFCSAAMLCNASSINKIKRQINKIK